MRVSLDRRNRRRAAAWPAGIAMAAMFVVAACGSTTPTGSPAGSGSPAQSGTPSSSAAASGAPARSNAPGASADASASGSPTPEPTRSFSPDETPDLDTAEPSIPPDFSPEPPPSFTPEPPPPSPVAVDACSLMSDATATKILFSPPASKVSGNGQGWISDSCTWLTEKGLPSVTVNVGTPSSIRDAGEGDAATLYAKEAANAGKPYGTKPVKVPGIGQGATYAGKLDNGQIVFHKDGYFVQISGIAVTKDRLIIAAKAVASRL
jgi:hypothetical protein